MKHPIGSFRYLKKSREVKDPESGIIRLVAGTTVKVNGYGTYGCSLSVVTMEPGMRHYSLTVEPHEIG